MTLSLRRVERDNKAERIRRSSRIDPQGSQPIARQLTSSLRHAIVTMELLPGEMLSEQEIATVLGISRQPIREAIINLRELGLIRVYPQRGTQISRISSDAVSDAQFIRETIECAVIRDAAGRAGRQDVRQLRQMLESQRELALKHDPVAFFEADERFHQQLCNLSGRPGAWEVIQLVKPQIDRVRFIDVAGEGSLKSNIDEHAGLVDAIESADPDLAAERMAVHLRAIRATLPLIRARNPDMFEV